VVRTVAGGGSLVPCDGWSSRQLDAESLFVSFLDHGSDAASARDAATDTARNARLGGVLFGVYLVLYGTFVALNAFAPQVIERVGPGGVNVAILYGFGLIVAAFALALVYGWLCRTDAAARSPESARHVENQSK
jgi:uncharacterized membrane protein (DUF485 family)